MHPDMSIPAHVTNTDNTTKRRQRKSYTQTILRAGFTLQPNSNSRLSNDSIPSLSCIEREYYTTSDVPIDFRHKKQNRPFSATSKTNSMVPFLGAASKSLLSSIQSSRIFASHPDSHAKDDTSKQGRKPIPKKMPVKPERILDLDTSISAAGPLSQGLCKATVSDGFGKLVYPNGTVKYIGMVRIRLFLMSEIPSPNLYFYVFIFKLKDGLPHGHGKGMIFADIRVNFYLRNS